MCEPTTLALGAASTGLGIMGSIGDYNSQQAQADSQNQWNRANYYQGIAIKRQQWGRQLQSYNFSKQTYESQRQWNALGAARSYNSDLRQLGDTFKKAAFDDQEGFTKLLQMQGRISASGQSGNSVDNLQKDVVAAFGRNQAIQSQELSDATYQTGHNMIDTWYDQYNKDVNAWSQVAVAPQYGMDPLPPRQIAGPSRASLMSSVGQQALGFGRSLLG
jgi:hypothetical protein